MVDNKTPWERLQAIWKDICVTEGYQTDPEQTEIDIRARYGDQAARSFRQATDNRQAYIDSMQVKMRPPENTHH